MSGETCNGCINSRREGNLDKREEICFRIVYLYSRFPLSACLFLFLQGECFQESCSAYDYVAQTGFRMEATGKVFESTIHLVQPVVTLYLARRVRPILG